MLDLYFNFRFKTQMSKFVAEYRKVSDKSTRASHALEPFTRQDMTKDEFKKMEKSVDLFSFAHFTFYLTGF